MHLENYGMIRNGKTLDGKMMLQVTTDFHSARERVFGREEPSDWSN